MELCLGLGLDLLRLDGLLGLLVFLLQLLELLADLLELRLELSRVLLPLLSLVAQALRQQLVGPLAQLAANRGVDQLEQEIHEVHHVVGRELRHELAHHLEILLAP